MDFTKPYNCLWLYGPYGPKPCKFIGARWPISSQTPVSHIGVGKDTLRWCQPMLISKRLRILGAARNLYSPASISSTNLPTSNQTSPKSPLQCCICQSSYKFKYSCSNAPMYPCLTICFISDLGYTRIPGTPGKGNKRGRNEGGPVADPSGPRGEVCRKLFARRSMDVATTRVAAT